MPPFFRASAGHRVEGRNPWHLHYSRNQLRAGTHYRRLVRSLSLRPSWLLASWADQTELGLSLPKASTSGLPAPKSPCGLPDITTAPNGELRRQDFHLQVQQLVSLRSLLWVPLDVRQKTLAPALTILYPVLHHTGLSRTTEEDA